MTIFKNGSVFLSLFCLSTYVMVYADSLPQATAWIQTEWLPLYSQTLDSLSGYSVDPENLELSKYGGWKARQVAATGFFRVEKIKGRWWAVDPEGYLFIHKALNSIHLADFTADEIYQLLPQYGFNGTGCWTDEDVFLSSLKEKAPLAYCPKFSFIAEYRKDRVPRIEMPVFDDAFVTFCNENAQYFAQYADDPHVFGYFSDNELPWTTQGLGAHLAIPDPNDKNYIAAVDFLAARGKTPENRNDTDMDDYTVLMAEAYFGAVGPAIKAVDSNHLYLGPRLNKSWRRTQGFIEVSGQYIDAIAINHYHRWGTRDVEIKNIEQWSGRPVVVSEFYAMESSQPETDVGAGWRVTDQAERGLFYHNYITKMAESGCVVGWQWFKFQDDEEGDKGIVDLDGNLYTELLNDMNDINSHIYNIIDYIDARRGPDVSLLPEADAYFEGSANRGGEPELLVKQASASVYRESYLRFDVSTLDANIDSAKICLYGIAQEKEAGCYQAEFVADDTWEEMTINRNNNPVGSTVLGTWSHGDDIQIDVTRVLLDAIETDSKLSIRIIGTLNNGSIPVYGSRENSNPVARPKLQAYYMCAGLADFIED